MADRSNLNRMLDAKFILLIETAARNSVLPDRKLVIKLIGGDHRRVLKGFQPRSVGLSIKPNVFSQPIEVLSASLARFLATLSCTLFFFPLLRATPNNVITAPEMRPEVSPADVCRIVNVSSKPHY